MTKRVDPLCIWRYPSPTVWEESFSASKGAQESHSAPPLLLLGVKGSRLLHVSKTSVSSACLVSTHNARGWSYDDML